MDSLFKTPSILPEIKEEIERHSDVEHPKDYSNTKPPPSVFAEIEKYPITADLLDCKVQVNHFGVKDDLLEIESFINSEIKRTEIEDNKGNFSILLNFYLKRAQLTEEKNIYTKIEKLVSRIKIEKKLIDAIIEKEKLLNSDPESLSAAKLKELIELKKG